MVKVRSRCPKVQKASWRIQKKCNRRKTAPARVWATSANTLFVQQTSSQDPALQKALVSQMKKYNFVIHHIF